MDALINAAARALAAGDPLGALNRVALRDDPPALALRGIAMAQLGDLARANTLLRRAARGFGAREVVARARCALAEAEIALAGRDLGWPGKALATAHAALAARGDRRNAAYARQLEVRRLVLIGRLDEAEARLADLDASPLPPAARVTLELAAAAIAMRRLRTAAADAALARAAAAAETAAIPALAAEVDAARRLRAMPVARRIARGTAVPLDLPEVEALLASDALVVDACRRAVHGGGKVVALATRPVLFKLARLLAEASPGDVPRAALIAQVFRGRQADESHRVRLRVEIGRLRRLLRGIAEIRATAAGFALEPCRGGPPVVLAPPVDTPHGDVLALLADGEAWSSSSLALALATSQRNVQRALDTLAADGRVRALGRGRARRWLAPAMPGIATILLLSAPPPGA